MTISAGNVSSNLPYSATDEVFEPILQSGGVRSERIISTGQATSAGEWLVQDWDEWVLLLAGEAQLQIEGESSPRSLGPDDWISIPASVRHRVEWTSKDPPAVWLALHFNRT